ncbi:MAG: glycosyltransferase [Chloroflexota bacterium]
MVSVVIPTYNAKRLVVKAIRSVLAQTLAAKQIVVVDDGSTDGTATALEEFGDQIQTITQANMGRSQARNRGIAASTSEFVAFLDADDTWYPNKLARQLQMLENQPEASWTYCKVRLIDLDGQPIESDFWPSTEGHGRVGASSVYNDILLGEIGISTSTVIVARSVLSEVGPFRNSLRSAEDTNLWLRMAKRNKALFVPEVLATRRVDPNGSFLERYISHDYSTYGFEAIKDAIERSEATTARSKEARVALLNRKLESVLILLASDQCEKGGQQLKEVLDADEWILSGLQLERALADFAISAARYNVSGPQKAEHVLDTVLNCLSEESFGERLAARSRAELFAIIAYMFYAKGMMGISRRYTLKGIRHQPAMLKNKGLIRRLLRPFGGSHGLG